MEILTVNDLISILKSFNPETKVTTVRIKLDTGFTLEKCNTIKRTNESNFINEKA